MIRNWIRGAGWFGQGANWDPAGVPRNGDVAAIATGEIYERGPAADGVVIQLQGSFAAGEHPTVHLSNSAVADITTLDAPQGRVAYEAKQGTVGVRGCVLDTASISAGGRPLGPGFLTVDIARYSRLVLEGNGRLLDGSSLTVSGGAGANLENDGTLTLSTGSPVRIMTALVGTGTIADEPAYGVPGASLELGRRVGPGETIKLDGGALQIDQPHRFLGSVEGLGAAQLTGITLEHVGAVANALMVRPGELGLYDAHFNRLDTLKLTGVASDFHVTPQANGSVLISELAQAGSSPSILVHPA